MSNNICDKHGKNCDLSCKDPNVDNGMMTKVWGPAGWLFMHAITFGYPYAINPDNPEHITKQEDYYKFFYYLGKVLPCKYCRESYQQFMNKLSPIDKLNTRKELTRWMYDLHNLVNDKLNVPINERPSFEDVEKTYENYRAKCATLDNIDSMEGFGNENTNNINNKGIINSIKNNEIKFTNNQEKYNYKNDKGKGCVIPANGKPCRSIIKIIEIPNSNISMNSKNSIKSNDYYIIKKNQAIFLLLLLFIIILIIVFYFLYNK